MNLLAFRPFIDSIQAMFPGPGGPSEYWLWFLVPLVVGISIVYKGTKVSDLRHLPKAATFMSLQIFAVMILGGIALYGGTYLITHYLY